MNDEMVMKGGVERSANPNTERMLNIFDLHLSAAPLCSPYMSQIICKRYDNMRTALLTTD
jgi:hypothetical protein